MDIKVPISGKLTQHQKDEIGKAFSFMASVAEGARQRKREGLPPVIPKADVPRLLRGCGRAPKPEELQELLEIVPEEGIELQAFINLYEQAHIHSPPLSELELFNTLRVLDLTRTDTLDPAVLREILMTIGDRMSYYDVEKVLDGLPRDGLGRVSCRLIARKLIKGPEEIPHL
eukprot:TRINITY_DN50704_c0_g1_i1.p1 TRINITY_DN50704_c0_g1~~TRINITY_DN50704_c0_g1_i1.p1  ORF type:complete len:173 (+),score=45.73 TRINITY_DN50704_c0_g1_i1:54-572(+)